MSDIMLISPRRYNSYMTEPDAAFQPTPGSFNGIYKGTTPVKIVPASRIGSGDVLILPEVEAMKIINQY